VIFNRNFNKSVPYKKLFLEKNVKISERAPRPSVLFTLIVIITKHLKRAILTFNIKILQQSNDSTCSAFAFAPIFHFTTLYFLVDIAYILSFCAQDTHVIGCLLARVTNNK